MHVGTFGTPTRKAAIDRYVVWPTALGGECSDLVAPKGMKLQDIVVKQTPKNTALC